MRESCLAIAILATVLVGAGCNRVRRPATVTGPKPAAFGAALVDVSGEKQIVAAGATLHDPVVVQVNDAQGAAVAGALVSFHGPAGVSFDPPSGLTDSSGQFTTSVALGNSSGRYLLTVTTPTTAHKQVELKIDEIALGYQQNLGAQLNTQYCQRCHDPESTPERVSNYDNLSVQPHAFNNGATNNRLSDSDLVAIITHGGPALNKSPEMPPYGYTLSKSDIQALIAYIRAISDPPYRAPGLVYAKN